MTEPNTRPRRQPEQTRTDVAPGSTGAELSLREKRKAEMKERSAFVANVVRDQGPLFAKLLPPHLPAPTFMAAAGAALYRNEALLMGASESPEAFLIALRESAALGHLPGTEHYWLTPRKDKGRASILGIEGYEGIIERMYRSGGVLSVHANVVCANDTFERFAGPGGRPLHREGGGPFAPAAERGEVIGAYAYAMLPGGVPSEVMTIGLEELLALRARHAANNPIWDNDPIPMYKKTPLRRLEKYVPVSSGYRSTAVQATAFVAEAGQTQLPATRMEDTVEAEDAAAEADRGQAAPVQAQAGQPVTDVPYNPNDWKPGEGDPGWDELQVTRPGEGVPPEVRSDA